MSNILNRSQKIIAYVLIVVIVFTAGVFTGRFVQKREQTALAAEINEQIEEESDELLINNTQDETISENALPGESSNSDNSKLSSDKSELNETSVSENTSVEEEAVSWNNVVYKPTWNESFKDTTENKTLEERAAIRSSYEETMAINEADKQIISNNKIDFSNLKIAFLGDSITMGKSGETPYPYLLKETLGINTIYNHGVGGSTIATMDGASAMTERVTEIPQDTDLIIVMGGTNDNFYQASWQFGFMDWEMKGEGTFCGELQLLMKKFKWSYPNAKVIFLTPPSNSYIDELREKNKNLLPQTKYIEAINYIGSEQGMPVVDLYNMNFLNSHDTDVMTSFMSDTVHPNSKGNELLAERVAAEIIKRYIE